MCQFAEELWESLSYYITSGESVGGACVLNYKTAQVHTHTLSLSPRPSEMSICGGVRRSLLRFIAV